MVNYRIDEDVKLIREILNLSQKQFAEKIDVDAITVARWETGKMDTNENNIEKIYTFALNNNIFINVYNSNLLINLFFFLEILIAPNFNLLTKLYSLLNTPTNKL